MSITDLRPYWMFKRKACGVEKPEPGPQLGWLCTLPRGHGGRHVAHDVDGTICAAWRDLSKQNG